MEIATPGLRMRATIVPLSSFSLALPPVSESLNKAGTVVSFLASLTNFAKERAEEAQIFLQSTVTIQCRLNPSHHTIESTTHASDEPTCHLGSDSWRPYPHHQSSEPATKDSAIGRTVYFHSEEACPVLQQS
jgi:hypothetical protein